MFNINYTSIQHKNAFVLNSKIALQTFLKHWMNVSIALIRKCIYFSFEVFMWCNCWRQR